MTFGWQGFQFDHPDDWAPALISGNRHEGYARIASPETLSAQIRWQAQKAGANLEAILTAYLDRLAKDAKKLKTAFKSSFEKVENGFEYKWSGQGNGKGSMFGKIPGDDWQKAATLRALYGFMYAHPGKKLMFMGDEFGQVREWNHDRALDWDVAELPLHGGLKRFVQDLNRIYGSEPALHEIDFDFSGFQWIDCNDSENSVVSLIRRSKRPEDFLVAVLQAENVLARRYFHPGVHRQAPYRDAAPSLPVTDEVAARVLVLPTGTAMSEADVGRVCAILRLAVARADELRTRVSS